MTGEAIGVFAAVLDARGLRPRIHDERGRAFCPVCQATGRHRSPGLSFEVGRERPLIICCHGPGKCEAELVLEAVNLTWADFAGRPTTALKSSKAKGAVAPKPARPDVGSMYGEERIVAVYDYHGPNGDLVYRICRTPAKQFPVASRDTSSPTGWFWGLAGVQPVLYRLPAVLDAVPAGRTVHIVEGEKDADSINSHDPDATDYVATTAPFGAGHWRPAYVKAFSGAARCVIWGDRFDEDHKGVRHALEIARSLEGLVGKIELAQARTGKDVSDHLAAGHALEDFDPLEIPEELRADSRSPSSPIGRDNQPSANAGRESKPETASPFVQIDEILRFIPEDAHAAFRSEVFQRILPVLARLSPADQDLAAQEVKKKLHLSLRAIRREIEGLRHRSLFAPDQTAPEIEPSEESLALLEDTNLIQRFIEDTATLGVVGEEHNKVALKLVMTSRKSPRPMNALVKGESSAGKNYVVETIASCFPPSEVEHATNLSPQALSYWDGDLTNKIFLITEAEGAERAEHDLRVLQSEGNITVHHVAKVGGELKTIKRTVKGPAATITTTTRESIHPENETRLLEISIDESEEQTTRILEYQRKQRAHGVDLQRFQAIRELWRGAQAALQPFPVIVPFAESLSFPTGRVRARRDFPKLLTLIETSAFLHQRQRERRDRDGQTYIVADLRDYALAYDLMHGFIERVQAGLNDRENTVLRLLRKAQEAGEDRLAARQVAERLGWYADSGRKRAKRCLDGLLDKGCAQATDPKPGTATLYWFREAPSSAGSEITSPEDLARIWTQQGGQLPTSWTSPLSRSK